jgi:hypothetical protein
VPPPSITTPSPTSFAAIGDRVLEIVVRRLVDEQVHDAVSRSESPRRVASLLERRAPTVTNPKRHIAAVTLRRFIAPVDDDLARHLGFALDRCNLAHNSRDGVLDQFVAYLGDSRKVISEMDARLLEVLLPSAPFRCLNAHFLSYAH